jgi:hypothetical protein
MMDQTCGHRGFRSTPIAVAMLLLGAWLTGCAAPVPVSTRAELVRNLGHKVVMDGTYEVNGNGEHVRRNDADVALDISPDILGFGRSPLNPGDHVKAYGTLERGAMSLGVFIDEQMLSASRGSGEPPIAPGFVLRDAKVEQVKAPASQPSGTGR